MSILASFIAGKEARRTADAAEQVNRMQQFLQQNGQAIFQGDQNALGQLAGMGPQGLDAAMGLRQQQDARAAQQAQQARAGVVDQRQDQQWQWQIEERAASMTAAERAAEAQALEDAVKMGLAAETPEQWDALVATEAPDLVGKFEMREAIAQRFMSVADILKQNAPPEPQSTLGKFYADQNAGLVPADATPPSGDGVNINMGGGTDKQIFDAMLPLSDMARTTATGYNAIKEAKAAVDAGIISGFGADNILSLQKLGAALGIADPTAIQNTETFRSAIAPQIAAILKATAGTANLSDSDRQFAEKAAGGNITLDEGSIKKLLGIMEKASRKSLEAYVGRLDQVYPNSPEYTRERAILGVQLPEFLPEDGTVPPPEAIDMLRQNNTPDFQRSFDEIFGQGAAARALGGN